MSKSVSRRQFLRNLSIGAAGLAVGAAVGYSAAPTKTVPEVVGPTRSIPSTPMVIGHMTLLTGGGAILGLPMLDAHNMAVDEINGSGGIFGRKLKTVQADEAAGADADVKTIRNMVLNDKIEAFTGLVSSSTTPVLAPVAEELKTLSVFNDGCTDFVFEQAVPEPKYTFRLTNIQSMDGLTIAVAIANFFPNVKKVAQIHPDYAYGHNAHDHVTIGLSKLLPNAKAEEYLAYTPLFGTPDFTPFITKILDVNPDILVSSLWGADFLTFYKQAAGYGLFKKMKVAFTQNFGMRADAVPTDFPAGTIAGCHANYYFNFPPSRQSPDNAAFVSRYFSRYKYYPTFHAKGAYDTVYLLKSAIEKASKLAGGGWPDVEAIISTLEGFAYHAPAATYSIRPSGLNKHQAYHNAVVGLSANLPAYPYPVVDPASVIVIPADKISPPPDYTGSNKPTAAYNWVKDTWPTVTS